MKIARIVLHFLLICGIVLLLTQKLWIPQIVQWVIGNEETSKVIQSAVSTSTSPSAANAAWEAKHEALLAAKCSDFCAPFDRQELFKTVVPQKGDAYVFTGTSTEPIITLQILTDKIYQARNPTFELYVGDVPAGKVSGQFFSQPSYSPDGKYFAFRGVSHLGGGGAYDTSLYIIDLFAQKVSELSTFDLADKSIAKDNVFVEAMSYLESYVWEVPDRIRVTEYTIASFPADTVDYRITPKKIWEFYLSGMPYPISNRSLIQTLPN